MSALNRDRRSLMKARSLVRWLSMVGVAALSMVGAASAADVHVMISAGFYGVYSELGPAFEHASGHHLVTTRGPSMGDSPEAIPTRLARGEAVARVVARGEAEIGFQQVSELIDVPGISFVGTIPAELQPMIFYAGALTSTVRQPEAASALIRFLASPEAAPVILKAGLMPLSER